MKCGNYTIEAGDWKIRDFIQIKSPEPDTGSGLEGQGSVSRRGRFREQSQ